MRTVALLLMLIVLGWLGWLVAGSVSPDAVAMAVGMLFGVLASVPVALLAMASGRRRDYDDDAPPRRCPEEPAPQPTIYNDYRIQNTYNDYRSTTNNTTNNRLELRDRGQGLQGLPPLPPVRSKPAQKLLGGGR